MKNLDRANRKAARRKMMRHRNRLRDEFRAEDWFVGIEDWMLEQDRLVREDRGWKFSRRLKRGWSKI